MIIRLDYLDGTNDQFFLAEDAGPTIVSKDEDFDPGAYLTFRPLDAAAAQSRQPRYGEVFYVLLSRLRDWTLAPNPPGTSPRWEGE